jgi:predicted DCC family thiol-disulfide oxidoreductase YuxK
VISPAPESTALSQALRFWYQPYLTLFRLDNMWEFFAPNIGGASQLRYNIEDDAGESQSFVPTEGLSWFHPSYFWIRSWSEAVTTNFGLYGASGAAALCRKHAALHPISITLLEYHEAKIYASGSLERREPHGPRVFRCEGFATLQMHNPVTLARCGRTAFTAIDRAWSRFWFQNSATSPLELARIGIGGALLVNYSLAAPYLFDFWSDSGWIPREIPLKEVADSWAYSVLFCFTAPWHWIAFHSLFLQCCFAFMVDGGMANVVGQVDRSGRPDFLRLSQPRDFLRRRPDSCESAVYPVSCADRKSVEPRPGTRRPRGQAAKPRRRAAPYRSPWACACTRLMQIQMAVVFFYSGASKLKGDDGWNGDAIWLVFTSEEYHNGPFVDFLASHYWLVNAATYGTVLIEIAFPFLIWQRATRPYLLAAAVLLHLQFAALMGLFYFAFVMIAGHMSFVRPEWLKRLGAAWKRMMGDLTMIYDGNCGFCVRSMAWLLAFDGLRQIAIRNFGTDPSPIVNDAQLEKALYTVRPGGPPLSGFEAYRYAVLRVPGLWWLIPLFYLPLFSRLLGRPIYDWVAANRGRLSSK